MDDWIPLRRSHDMIDGWCCFMNANDDLDTLMFDLFPYVDGHLPVI